MRKISLQRKTKETLIKIDLVIEGKGRYKIRTTNPFFDHMLELFSFWGSFNLKLEAHQSKELDFHHLNEDIGIALGQAFLKILKKEKNIKRYSSKIIPMDGSLVRLALDISGRPGIYLDLGKAKKFFLKNIENYNLNLLRQFLKAFTDNFKVTLHVDILKADDAHHVIEAIFKGLGQVVKEALSYESGRKLPSTKGKL